MKSENGEGGILHVSGVKGGVRGGWVIYSTHLVPDMYSESSLTRSYIGECRGH